MTEARSRYSAPLQVLLMIGIIAATIVLGFFMMPDTSEERDRLLGELGTTNHGTFLVPVRDLAELPLRDGSGAAVNWREGKPKWRLLIPAGTDCLAECDEVLYSTRQVHVRLGKYSQRLERVLIATQGPLDPDLSARLETEHAFVKVWFADGESFANWLRGTNAGWRQGQGLALLVDPAGVAMMVYDVRHLGNDMLEDINHLMKYSPE